jgi:putative transposase
VKGRKRFGLVDTQGWMIEVLVLPASVPERAGAEELFWYARQQESGERLGLIWADGGFAGSDWEARMEERFGLRIEIVRRSPQAEGFEVLPRRWVVERTFGWLGRYRRLSKDYEANPRSSRAWILWAMIDRLLQHLFPSTDYPPFRYRSV